MQKVGLNELRERFLKFFESKDHLRLPSFSLIPRDDPSLLLINSGMAPLKPYFTGEQEPPSKRITTCQKCIRTPDIENVGKTARHGTFFEMLGNFSFGDYFKKEAIAWAWEFITEDLKIPKELLWISIYEDDDEAFDIWANEVGVSKDKIVRMGKEDNFWEHGIGPCGPSSEIYFDRGLDKGCGHSKCKVGCDCDRYIEFWNNVFTQFNKGEDGSYTKLAHPNIDTGLGLERLACIMQGVDSLFEVDTIKNVLNHICKIAKIEYGKSEKTDISVRVITDHIRSTTMMVCDGVIPSNEGRGYVLRRLLRRAARHGKLIGINETFLYRVAMTVIEESKQAYPELKEKSDYILKVIKTEEERFEITIDQGLTILNEYISKCKEKKEKTISGDVVFKLHDTFGFPLDLTKEIASENGLEIDGKGFDALMTGQKEKGREALKNKGAAAWSEGLFSKADKSLKTEFAGYTSFTAEGKILVIAKDNEIVDIAREGDFVTVILDKTSFYAESGGQAGDIGVIKTADVLIKIDGCKKTADGKFLHTGLIKKGSIKSGDSVKTEVDAKRRMAIARNHTATHLLQKALRNTLGSHIEQSGSMVDSERLRFDFKHFSPITMDELSKIEKEINQKILEALPVETNEMSVKEAKKAGAVALFGEKYGDVVRVVKIDNYSMELCGGTHLTNTSQASLIKILGESGVAAGVRRIEALTGESAMEYYIEKEKTLNEVAATLKTAPNEALKRIETMSAELKKAEKELERLQTKLVRSSAADVLSNVIEIKGVKVLCARYDQLDMDALRNTGDMLKGKLGSGIIVLGGSIGDKVNFVVMATPDVIQRGAHSGNIIREVAKITGGGGGGRPDMAQAGGKDVSKIDEALKAAVKIIEDQLK
ncbi:MAG: alanine--tRNA ligase [Clostridia bacterium]|jgi:alanyl-tRNA synthetase